MDVVVKIVVAVLLGSMGFVFTSLLSHGDRLTRIEASRYTSADGLRDHRIVMSALKDLEIPPAWFAERVSKMEKKLDEIQTDLAEVKAKVNK